MAPIRDMFAEFFCCDYHHFVDTFSTIDMIYDPTDCNYKISYDVATNENTKDVMIFAFALNNKSRTICITRRSKYGNLGSGTATINMMSEFGQKVMMRCNDCYAGYLIDQENKNKLEEERRLKKEAEDRKVAEAFNNFFEMNIAEDPEF